MFQSTLPHGERQRRNHAPHHSNRFNPRSHMGSDTFDDGTPFGIKVSIHAPTWGATVVTFIYNECLISFNPRSHMGSDVGSGSILDAVLSFNPRSHMGSDRMSYSEQPDYDVSIHAPTWGATFWYHFTDTFI